MSFQLALLITFFLAATYVAGIEETWRAALGLDKKYLRHAVMRNFSQAQQYCQTRGGRLLQPESKEETDYVQFFVASSNIAWLNAKRQENADGEGNFVWIDGNAVIRYSNWKVGALNHTGPRITMDSDGFWETSAGNVTGHVICEYYVMPWYWVTLIFLRCSLLYVSFVCSV